MKTNVFVCADLHLGHKGITQFNEPDGRKSRPWSTPDEMDEALIQNFNSVVKPTDKVYILGDVVINRRCLPTIGRLNGKKVLVKGNHDLFRLEEYAPYFYDIRACHIMDDFILTHIPVHPNQFPRFKGNVHGHLHHESVNTEIIDSSWFGRRTIKDPKYLCVSMEQISYTPIAWGEVVSKFNSQRA